jgi:hypothetical protein
MSNRRLDERCNVLAQVVKEIAPIYHAEATTDNQKQLVECIPGKDETR